MAKTIEQLLEELVAREGGFVDHPADRGGPTNWGITEQVARAYGYGGPMRSLPRATALEIYRARYWQRPGFAAIAEHAPRLAEELFDTGVNMGPKVAAVFLQRALNGLNANGAHYADLEPDGDIGPMTLAALAALFNRRSRQLGELVLLRAVDSLQGARYIEIAERNRSQEAFLFGWLRTRVGAA